MIVRVSSFHFKETDLVDVIFVMLKNKRNQSFGLSGRKRPSSDIGIPSEKVPVKYRNVNSDVTPISEAHKKFQPSIETSWKNIAMSLKLFQRSIFAEAEEHDDLNSVPQPFRDLFTAVARHVTTISDQYKSLEYVIKLNAYLMDDSVISQVSQMADASRRQLSVMFGKIIDGVCNNKNQKESKPKNNFQSLDDYEEPGSDIVLTLDGSSDEDIANFDEVVSPSETDNVATNTDAFSEFSKDLKIESDGYTAVFTDGACSNNGRGNAQAGIGVWFNDNHPLNISEPVVGVPTNNNAEIQAVIKAINQAKRASVRKLRVYTDSKFLISCMTDWIKNWRKNGWISKEKKPVKNQEVLKELDRLLKTMEVDWQYVAAHNGIIGNERADYLAREGAKQFVIKEKYVRVD